MKLTCQINTYDVTDNEIMNLAKKNFNHDLDGNRKRYI